MEAARLKTKIQEGRKSLEDREENQKRIKPKWEKPSLEDVSLKIMAQPYIRFT